MTPVTPPATNTTMNPSTQSIGVRTTSRPSRIVTSQAKIWMPEGMVTSRLEALKNDRVSCGRPTANMWCTHTPKLMIPVSIVARTISG